VFTLSWATRSLGYARQEFLVLQLIATVFFAICIPLSARFTDQRGRTAGLLIGTAGIMCLGVFLGPMLQAGSVSTVIALSIGMALMGASFGPLGALMSRLLLVGDGEYQLVSVAHGTSHAGVLEAGANHNRDFVCIARDKLTKPP